MTAKEKYCRLIRLLYQKTMNREVKWETSSFPESALMNIARRRVVLSHGENENQEPLEYLTIFDHSGNAIEGFSDEVFDGDEPTGVVGFDTYFSLMFALREAAYRQATGADSALDDIISALDDDALF